MGKTAFSGPAYGAKSLLLTAVRASSGAISTTAPTVFGAIRVPSGEDWFITSLHAYRGSTASTTTVVSLIDDASTIADVPLTSSLAGTFGSTVLTPTRGEYEGRQVEQNSTLQVAIFEGGSSIASSNVVAHVYGYPRFVSSTRAE